MLQSQQPEKVYPCMLFCTRTNCPLIPTLEATGLQNVSQEDYTVLKSKLLPLNMRLLNESQQKLPMLLKK